MQKIQFIYDAEVQFFNRDNFILYLINKIQTLKQRRDELYQAGQKDKKLNKRRETLLEYRNQISACDISINYHTANLETMKRRNGYLKRDDSREVVNLKRDNSRETIKPDVPHARGRSRTRIVSGDASIIADKMEKIKRTRSTPRYPLNVKALEAVADVIVDSGNFSQISDEMKSWIINYYDGDDREQIIKKLISLGVIPNDSKCAKPEPSITDESIQTELAATEKMLKRSRSNFCCFS